MYPPVTAADVAALLEARFREGFLTLRDLPSPYSFKDMKKAARRIALAIRRGERIAVVGDYDVDGTVATAVMLECFEAAGCDVQWIVPNRFEDGYGLSVSVINKLDNPHLIVTVDNGIAAVEAANVCKERGIELIITDHHLLPPQVPEAYAVIDPKQPDCPFPYDEVCGAQIAWYLAAALKEELCLSLDLKAMLDLIAVATVADMMPLRHINRAMVIAGLQQMAQSRRPAMRAFLKYLDKAMPTAEDIGFVLAPLINSAGRMEDASLAVEFLRARNIYDAQTLLGKLVATNEARKSVEAKLTKEALAQAKMQEGVIVAHGEGWHEGVVGIVAARVARACKRPALILSRNEKGVLKGSGRSFHGCDLFTLLSSAREVLDRFGGHKAAVGLSLSDDRLEMLRRYLDDAYDPDMLQSKDEEVLGALPFSEISFDLLRLLERFEPYGTGNPKPKFYTAPLQVVASERIGKEKNHVRYMLEHNGIRFEALHFKTETMLPNKAQAEAIYTLAQNRFRGTCKIELYIEEITPL